MKKILVTGANSYIGDAAAAHLRAAGHAVTVVDMQDGAWAQHDFSAYDCVFHVAGIAHLKEKKKNKALYDQVNAKLPVAVASKAKDAGVSQLIFMSSMSVYAGYGNATITPDKAFKPKGYYGDSKLRADLALQEMADEGFRVAVLRPPMIFGKDCKGNFPRLASLSKKVPFFPKIKNARSMLHIDNLCEFVRLLVESGKGGVFFPQNPDYFCTSDLVRELGALQGRKVRLTRLFNWLVWMLYPFMGALKKLFGNLTIDKTLSTHFDNAYQIRSNEESVNSSL